MNKLEREGILKDNDYKSLSICEPCLLEKMIKLSFTEKGKWASDVLGLIHTNVCGPISTSAKMDIITLLRSQMTYLGMDTSTW